MNTTFQHQIFSVKKSFCLLILWVGMLFCSSGLAQVYPVQVSTQLIPPYSLKLSDYVTTHSDKLIANILMTDINEYNRQLRFRLTIKGNGLHIRSNDFIIGANPVFIDGGLPLRLTNIDLRPYFELQNLQGITPQQYKNPLPDGNYQFCIEVFDWVSGQRLSNPQLGCSNAYLIVNDPPFLNLPRNGDLVEFKNPQNIIFNWTPRHLNATNVQYEFELRELWDTQIDPRAAFSASPNLYQTTTRNNTLLYGPGQTPLLENKTYGWRVRALVSDGISETSVFRNNGYSEIYYFTYAAGCSPPEFILAKSLSSNSEEITWQPNVDYKAYKVQYKKKGVRGAVWFDTNTTNAHARIYNLEPGTTYEFRVGGQCMLPIANQEPRYTFSSLQEFTTPTKEEDSYYNCGIAPEIRIKNKNPLPNLAINEVFTAGDFPVTVKGIEGQDGIFSGIGYIVVPYLADTKIAVEFNNIRINTDYQLYAGTLYTTYDPDWGNVDDISDELEAIGEIPEAIGELADLISKLFKKREEELKNLRQLQDDLTNGTITQEEFDKQAEQIGINVKVIDEQINGSAKEGVINSPYATDQQKEAIKELKPTALADNNDLSKTDVDAITEKDTATNAKIQEIANEVAEQKKETENYLFSILMAMKAMDGDAFVKCKQCGKEKDGSSVIDGKAVYTLAKLGGKSLKCILGAITENGTINFERLIQETSTDEQKQTFKKEFAMLTDLIAVDKKEQFLVVSTKNNNLQQCTTPLTFPNNYCEKAITDEISEEEKGYLAEELQDCLQTSPNETIANMVTFTSNEAINYTALKQQLQKQLDNAFFADVKLAVNLKRNGAIETLRSSGLANVNSADITLNIQVNEIAQTVNIGTLVSENYLNEYVSKLQQEANRRGIDVDVEELRKQVLLDLQEKETIGWFANLAQNTKALFNDKIGGFVEVLQSSQKIVKNVWDEGTINASTWHSIDPDYTQWPEYAQFHPLLGGGTDGVIDEIVGIPMAIKGVYGVMTDAEQREALKGMFTGEGLSQLIDGIAKEAQDTYNDNDKLQHFGAQTTISVASSITGVGIFTKGGKLAGTLQQLTNKISDLTGYPKLTQFLDDVKKQDWYDEAFKTFQKQFDELIAQVPVSAKSLESIIKYSGKGKTIEVIKKLHALKDVPGLDKVIADMGQYWSKFRGGIFQLDYAEQLLNSGKKISFEVSDLSDDLRRIYDITYEAFEDGRRIQKRLELKNWNNFYPSTVKSQLVKDLAKMEYLGDIQWIFNKTENIPNMGKLKDNVLKALKKADGSPVEELIDNLDEIKVQQLFPNDALINETNYAQRLLKNLENDGLFDQVFEIVE